MTETYKLYEISGKLEELNNLIENLEGITIPAELAETFKEILAEAKATEKDFADKVDNIASLIQSRKRWMQVRKEESDRLNQLIRKDDNTINWLSDYLMEHLEKQGVRKLRTKKFNLTIANNGGKLPVVIDSKIDPKDLPRKYINVSYSPNKNAIREALEKGEELNFAYFGERGKSLIIK
jgi:ferritin